MRYSVNKLNLTLYLAYFIIGTVGYKLIIDVYWSPLQALTLGFFNELKLEINRLMTDRKINNQVFTIIRRGKSVKMKSKNIRAGDIVKLGSGDRVPADIILLHCSEGQRGTYIKTDQIDGEIDWKNKVPVKTTQKLLSDSVDTLLQREWEIILEKPNNSLKSFHAYINDEGEKEPIGFNNFLLANSTIAIGEIYGLVTFVGGECKHNYNKQKTHYQVSQIDGDANNIIGMGLKFYFMLVLLTTIISCIKYNASFISIFIEAALMNTAFLGYNNITCLNVFGHLHKKRMKKDNLIEGLEVTNILRTEELGRIEVLLTDKTGTLTQNKLKLRKIVTKKEELDIDGLNPEMKERVISICKKLEQGETLNKEDKDIYNTILCFLLCSNIAPVADKRGRRKLKLSSPDEKAYFKFLKSIGFKVKDLVDNEIEIQNPLNKILRFKILYFLPFLSKRKRMDVVIKDLQTDQIMLFFKGADSMIKTRVDIEDSIFITESSEDIAVQGMRTIACACREITTKEFINFKVKMDRLERSLEKREELIDLAIYSFEKNSTVLAVTGIEDQLQWDVSKSLSILRKANIKSWMLTGDKLETAKCISISTGLKPFASSFFILNSNNKKELKRMIKQYNPKYHFLTLTGNCFSLIVKDRDLRKLFLPKAIKTESLCLCRCLPDQKVDFQFHMTKTGCIFTQLSKSERTNRH